MTGIRGIGRLAAIAAAAGLCGCAEPVGSHPAVAGARVYIEGVATSPVVLTDGVPALLEVRFVGDDGEEIELRTPEHAVRVRTTPGPLLEIGELGEDPFARRVSVRTPCPATPGYIRVGYGHWGSTYELEFGPFPVEIRDPVGDAVLADTAGTALDTVRIAPGDTLPLATTLFDCDGAAYDSVPEGRLTGILQSTAEIFTVTRVEGTPDRFILTTDAPVGTTGQISISYGTAEHPLERVFGPWRVEVGG